MRMIIDDFGIDIENDRRILKLLENSNQFYGVSCIMQNRKIADRSSLIELSQFKNIKIGLHLTLTNFNSSVTPENRLPSFFKLLTASIFLSKNENWVDLEISQQIHIFRQIFGRFPDFIDGHQHVHQFPRIRNKILNQISTYRKYFCQEFFIRNTSVSLKTCFKVIRLGPLSFFKNAMLGVMGAFYKKEFLRHQLPTNKYLLGTYSSNEGVDFKEVVSVYEASSGEGDIFYCHPGYVSLRLCSFEKNQPKRDFEYKYFVNNAQGVE